MEDNIGLIDKVFYLVKEHDYLVLCLFGICIIIILLLIITIKESIKTRRELYLWKKEIRSSVSKFLNSLI